MKMNRREPCCFSRYVARTTFAVVNNLYCVPAYVVWTLALRSIRPFSASLYWKIEGVMFHWLLAMVSMWSWTAGYEIVESGDDPSKCHGQRTLIIANHQSTADVPMLMAAWNPRPGVLANLMWIMDRLFKYTNFGLVSYLHQDFFIQAGRNTRDQSLLDLRKHIHGYYIPLQRHFIVLFPEGGFFYKRREVSLRFAEKNNLPKLDYVTVPRVGAMKVIMEEAGPQSTAVKDSVDKIKWILDVTIAYEDRKPLHLQDVVCGFRPPCTTHLHYRLYPSTDVPTDPEGMTKWLYDRFFEKDKMLEEFYRTGQFPTRGSGPQLIRPVRQDNFRFLLLHLFYIASTYLHIRLVIFMFSFLLG